MEKISTKDKKNIGTKKRRTCRKNSKWVTDANGNEKANRGAFTGVQNTIENLWKAEYAGISEGMTPHSIWNNANQTTTVIKISTEREHLDK